MGIAVNEFAKSPVGLWTITLITWKFMGNMLTHMICGVMIWIMGFTAVWWIIRRSTAGDVVYDPEKRDYFGRSVKVREVRQAWGDGEYSIACFGFLITLVVGLWTFMAY